MLLQFSSVLPPTAREWVCCDCCESLIVQCTVSRLPLKIAGYPHSYPATPTVSRLPPQLAGYPHSSVLDYLHSTLYSKQGPDWTPKKGLVLVASTDMSMLAVGSAHVEVCYAKHQIETCPMGVATQHAGFPKVLAATRIAISNPYTYMQCQFSRPAPK